MTQFNRNNLDKSTSPYLQQHKDNPIHWQEWNNITLEQAKKENKPILVSIGYATCHWCHVMASEAFSNKIIADYLNNYYISVKVDREQRPDIDRYMMSYIQETQGQGGWPLNVFITPDQKPILAVTYVPATESHGMPSFISLLQQVKMQYETNKESIIPYKIPETKQHSFEEKHLINQIAQNFDGFFGGFGGGQKFPPHNTLLFLLTFYQKYPEAPIKLMITKTLDKMAIKGLHDHLQGGFYRYCTDREWTIPHFEKMLYDNAMLLWVYSIAYKTFNNESYKTISNKIIECLEQTFEENNLYYSGHDADTNHEEGTTYLWKLKELKETLNEQEFKQFNELYQIDEEGNFENSNHLIKNKFDSLSEIEKKLLIIRKKRPQPFTDKKLITSWNCLTGIALLQAFRHTNNEIAKEKAINLYKQLIKKHYLNNKLSHSSLNNNLQEGEFLEDYASFLLLATYIHEETNNELDLIKKLLKKINEFKNHTWIENKTEDFNEVPATDFDHPTPSSISLAEFAIFRANIILDTPNNELQFKHPNYFDFHNVLAFLSQGNLHEIKTKDTYQTNFLPINSIIFKDLKNLHCFNKTCQEFSKIFNITFK